MKEQIEQEIQTLLEKVEKYKQEIVLSDGAIQAFRHVLSMLPVVEKEQE